MDGATTIAGSRADLTSLFMLVLSGSAIRAGKDRPNPADFLDSLPRPWNQARAPVIVPEAVAFKLQTTAGPS